MKVTELSNASHLRPQKHSGRDTPHATIETNTNCNIRCKFCYAIENPMVKSLDAVKAEIDLACEKRNLDAISLLGGEPTLHPDILEIVRYVKHKGLTCMLLTNGVRFLYHDDLPLLRDLVGAGVDRFMLHVDTGQAHVHGDIDQARHRMARIFDAHEVWWSLSLTLSEGRERDLPQVLCDMAHYRFFDGVLVTLATDFDHALQMVDKRRQEPDFLEMTRALEDQMGLQAAAYIPSNLDDDDVSWLMYVYWINAETGATFCLSPELNRAMKWLYRRTHHHEFFAETLDPDRLGRALATNAAAELALHPRKARALKRLLQRSDNKKNLRFHYVVVQQPPRMNAEHGQLQFCWQCPDAVIRNGNLVPVCIAGRLDPLGDRERPAPRDIVETVFHHLGQKPPP